MRRRLAKASELQRLQDECGDEPFLLLLGLVEKRPELRDRFAKAWGDAVGFAYVDTSRTFIQPEALARVPETFAREHGVLPLYTMDEVTTVATSRPDDPRLVHQIENLPGGFVSPVFDLPDSMGRRSLLATRWPCRPRHPPPAARNRG